jgi:hypothetical protein
MKEETRNEQVNRRISGFTVRRRALALVVAVGAATTMFAAIPTALAYADDVETVTFTADSASVLAGAPEVISCRITVSIPAPGNAVDGTLEVHSIGLTRCSSRVAEISQNQRLSYGGTDVSEDDHALWDTRENETNPYYICLPGRYASDAEAWIYPPLGYLPFVGVIHKTTSFRDVSVADCTTTTTGGGGGPGDPNCPIACVVKGGAQQGPMAVEDRVAEPVRR